MKRWSTTPVSKGLVAKSVIVATVVVMAIAGPMAMMPKANADKYDDQISALENEIAQYQAEASKLNQQANTLQAELAKLNAEKATLQGKIDLSQAKFNKLQKQIKETKKKISDNKDALGVIMADMYVGDTISPLEMLASSENIGDYVDKQTYRSSISDELQQTIDKIAELKKDLETQKKDVSRVLADQKNQRAQLQAKEVERQSILRETRGKESAYQSLTKKNREKIESIKQEQATYFQSLSPSASGITAGDPNKGGYPAYLANAAQDSISDPWGMYNRECVSYTAWKVDQKTRGKMPFWGGKGMAWQWAFDGWTYPSGDYRMGQKANYNTGVWHTANADAYHIPSGTDPRPGSVAVKDANPSAGDPFGHVAWVERVSGNQVYISQYNWYNAGGPGWGHYSEMWVSKSFFQKYIYF